MTPIRTLAAASTVALASALALAACSKETPPPAAAPTASADAASSPLPGVIGQPSDVTADHTPTSPSAGATAVGGLSTHPENGTGATGTTAAPTGGDAAAGHAASSASP